MVKYVVVEAWLITFKTLAYESCFFRGWGNFGLGSIKPYTL